jgi:hypothetical protein
MNRRRVPTMVSLLRQRAGTVRDILGFLLFLMGRLGPLGYFSDDLL